MRTPDHLQDNPIAKLYRTNRYRVTLSNTAYFNLIQHLEAKEREGGTVVTMILQNFMHVLKTDRATSGNDRSLAAVLARGRMYEEMPAEDEGIPGHNPGSANTARDAPQILPKLTLGPMPMETDLVEDVRGELHEEDERNPPVQGQKSLLDEFEHHIKREPSEDPPARDALPLPPSLARDVAMEVQRVKENRDRYQIPGRTGGVGPGISVAMFTFHNSYDNINCIDFSGDSQLVAIGTSESYIRVFTMDGSPLPGLSGAQHALEDGRPTASRKLIGHSGPVYAISFSPSICVPASDENSPTSPQYLLSCSADNNVRLWSLETYTTLCVYSGHSTPVWDVSWGPHGHYFVSGSWDRSARLWSTDHFSPLRMFVGHNSDVCVVAWHPNGVYVFTGSDDKTLRMWDVQRGSAVRMFTGHTGPPTALACSPNGKTLASADDQGVIILWDLASGRRVKVLRGHARGGIWSLSWSVESSVLVSGASDGTVRVWDTITAAPNQDSAASSTGKVLEPSSAKGIDVGVGAKPSKGKKDVQASKEQISAFLTKKTPVYKVRFTNTNLVLAGGAYLP